MKRSYRFTQNVKLTVCDAVGEPLVIVNTAIARPLSPTSIGQMQVATSTGLQITNLTKGAIISATAVSAVGVFTAVTAEEIIFEGTQFAIVMPLANDYVIKIFQDNKADFNLKYLGVNDISVNDRERVIYFKLPRSLFQTACDERLAKCGFTFGALVMPIKMRFGSNKTMTTTPSGGGTPITTHNKNFTFSGEISAGLVVGVKHDFNNRSSLSLLTGISLTSIPIDDESTGGFVASPTNVSAISWPIGALLQFDRVQFGLFVGLDYLSGEVAHHWKYKDNLWLGIGIGFSIFTVRSSNSQ